MTSVDASRTGAALGVVLVAVVVAFALLVASPPAPVKSSAAADEFSAERAMAHVEAVAATIHPMGSPGHAAAREYLLEQLRSLGLEPEVQTASASQARGAGVFAARVHNILVRLEGDADGPALALMSHYDSVPTGPGAGDAATGVAAILETVRAVLAGEALRNDLIVVITDGEEAGLLGARAFADEHPWMADVGLVLNFEARGNSGLVTMFETSDGNARLVRELAAAAPHPWASSLSYEVYRRMPNDTDLTVTRRSGAAGLNFAMIGNHVAYHTELDSSELLDQRSLQHMGSYALSLSRRFGSLDLTPSPSLDAVYFNPIGTWLVVYSLEAARALAVATFAVLGVVFFVARRRQLVEARMVGRGALAAIGLPIVCALLLGALWNLVEHLFPAVLAAPHGDPYQASTILLGFLLIGIGVATLVAGLVEAADSLSLQLGTLGLWTVLTLVLSFTVAGASYLTLWPALVGGLALGLLVMIGEGARRWAVGLLAIGPLVTAAIFPPVVRLVAEALSVTAAPVQGLVLGLPLAFLLPQLKVLTGGRLAAPVLSSAVGLAVLGWVGWSASPTPQTPALASLYYALDSEKGEAFWVSYETERNDWTGQAIPEGTAPGPMPGFLPGRSVSSVLAAAAPPLDLSPPAVELVSDRFEDGVRTLTLGVRSTRGATWLTLVPDASMATVAAMGVADRMSEIDESAGPVVLTLQGVPDEGIEVVFQLIDRQPMKIDLLDVSFGLPEFDGGSIGPRPAGMMRSTRWLSDTTTVRRVAWF